MDLLDPQTYRTVRRPLLSAQTLPPQCYSSAEFYRREVSEIFHKCWNLVGREDYVQAPADYFTHALAGASLKECLGGLDGWTESYEFQNMVTVKRREFTLRANWKSYVENSLEHFHLPTVHQKTIGAVKAIWEPVDGAPGNFVILRSKANASRATLGNAKAFDRIATLRGPAAEGAQYILIYPCTVIGADLDSMWFKQMLPDGPDKVRLLASFCFTRQAFERHDFEEVVENYHRRFDLVMGEDNDIAETHYRGISNPLARARRFSSIEPLVHTIDNWILDRVIGKDSR